MMRSICVDQTSACNFKEPDVTAASEATAGARAVVVGASIGGILAARVLSDVCTEVTVVDRDTLPEGPVERKGAAQAYHSHGLLVRGREILEELFPGVTEELIEAGAIRADMQRQVIFYNEGRHLAVAPSDLVVLAASRALLESTLRRRIAALPGVTILDRHEVTGLRSTDDRSRVTGVQVVSTGEQAGERAIAADVVIDSSGRSNRCVAWLGELGYAAPAEETVKSGIVYASQEFRRDPADEKASFAVGLSAVLPRGAAAIAAEGDRWICTLVATPGQEPPTDTESFAAFADSLLVPAIAGIVHGSEPISDVTVMRLPTNFWRRFDRIERLPEGFVVFGDALCFLNATYGQGMTVAASEAIVLRECLADGLDGIGRRFFAAAKGVVEVPWMMSSQGDLRFPWVEGKRTTATKVMSAYMRRLNNAAVSDPKLAYSFLRVVNMLAKPQTLFAPPVLFRVLRPRPGAQAKQGSL
jgi:2-polyprenyl-6-methoxyphenol hydroxylase-like FAD-dependent oxidoreductase